MCGRFAHGGSRKLKLPLAACWLAGLAAQHLPGTAVRLVAFLLAVQTTYTLLALALRPYNSVVLNCIEVVCGCLDAVTMALTMVAYMHTSGEASARAGTEKPAHLQVRACRHELGPPCRQRLLPQQVLLLQAKE
jgi:hypothetical protein